MRGNLRSLLLVGLWVMVSSPAARAADGVLEINQVCATSGCFPGDTPGFPVTLTSPGSYRLTGNYCGFGCSVRGNTVRLNEGFGLRLGPDSAYRENVVTGNLAGTVTGTGTNVGDNHCAGPGVVSASCP